MVATIFTNSILKLEEQDQKKNRNKNQLKKLILDPQLNHLHHHHQSQIINFSHVEHEHEQEQEHNLQYLYATSNSKPTKKRSFFSPENQYARTIGTKPRKPEIVEVHGGRIVRSIGRKDRHSKVFTAKGPRDRRVRLSAPTAIQFYDVQDRLGYDRPSKAVDWLINKAKSAIDKLRQLPLPNPNVSDSITVKSDSDIDINDDSPFLPPSFDSESFFPIPLPNFEFQAFPPDLLSRTNSRNRDLRLSLQSIQDPIPVNENENEDDRILFSETVPVPFGSFDGWSETPNFPPSSPILQPLFGENPNQLFSQRGPLQSSNTPSFRALIDPSSFGFADNQHQFLSPAIYQPPFSGLGFAPGGFSRFLIPTTRNPGGQEEHEFDGVSDKPSSASSNSRH